MSNQQSASEVLPAQAAYFAEAMLSSEYRDASNTDFKLDPDASVDHRKAAQAVVAEVAALSRRERGTAGHAAWELSRLATLSEIEGQQFGGFEAFLHGHNAAAAPATTLPEELPTGEYLVKKTNEQVVALSDIFIEPIDFMDTALDMIKHQSVNAVGPENYATAFKFFADKYMSFPSAHLDRQFVEAAALEGLGGFLETAKYDRPNFIEMTNIFTAIKRLPPGIIAGDKAQELTHLSVELLPELTVETLKQLVGAYGKLGLEKAGSHAANLLDLVLRQGYPFEKTIDLQMALSAVANLPQSAAAQRAFNTLLTKNTNLEQSLTIDGAEAATLQLKKICDTITDQPELIQKAKAVALRAVESAMRHLSDAKASCDGRTLTAESYKALHASVQRAASNYAAI